MNHGFSVLAVSAAATAPLMGLFLPPWYEVRYGQHDPASVRRTAIIGGIVVVLVAVAASFGVRSAYPVVGAAMGAMFVYAAYRLALAGV